MDKSRPLSIDQTTKTLNNVSPSVCGAKWKTSHLHLNMGLTHSCHQTPTHIVPRELLESDPSVLCNTPELKQQRQAMLNGERPEPCNICWGVEDSGFVSERIYKSSMPWISPYLEGKENIFQNTSASPSYVEVSFSNACNLSCSYCNANFSSSWQKEVRENGPLSYFEKDQFLISPSSDHFVEEENPYINAFWQWLDQSYRSLHRLRITGGEPLLSANTFKIFDYVEKNPHPDLILSINSNLSVPEKRFDEFTIRVKRLVENKAIGHFTLFPSIDSWGPQAEFTRRGLQLKLFERNLRHYVESCEKSSLCLMVTFQALAVPGFGALLDKLKGLKKEYDGTRKTPLLLNIAKLEEPEFLSLLMLPKAYSKMIQSLEPAYADLFNNFDMGLNQAQFDRVEYLRAWMNQECDGANAHQWRAQFYVFMTRYEQMVGQSFEKVFPEYAELWDECKMHYNNFATKED